ncbi:MAG TPA: hypothetical protein VIV12_31150 [Streptosporangiaceae bacterium]
MGNEQLSPLDAIVRQGGPDAAADVPSGASCVQRVDAQVPVPADVQHKPVEIGGVYVIGSAATLRPAAG